MNIVIVDKKEVKIKTTKDVIMIDEQKVPFRLIDTIIMIGSYTLSSSDIMQLTKNGITLLFISNNYKNSSITVTTSTKNAQLKLSQYSLALTPLKIAKHILIKKLIKHKEHLSSHNKIVDIEDKMKNINQASSLETLLGIEGSFSKVYFKEYFSLIPKVFHKHKRTKHPPLDPLNALLSFTYTLFYNLIAIKLISFGFEPSIGYLHRPFRTHYAFASDVLELFRADINEFVLRLIVKKEFELQDFSKHHGVYLRYEARKKFWKYFREFYKSKEFGMNKEIALIKRMIDEKNLDTKR